MTDTGKKVLIVDDEPDTVRYLTALLEDNGFAVLAAYNGRDGMELARKELPDLIALDITMPEESGVRMLRNLQAEPTTKETPVVLVTGVDYSFKKFIETRRQIEPPAAYFEKPIDEEQFLKGIRRILGILAD